jgi:predicted amidohydrolase
MRRQASAAAEAGAALSIFPEMFLTGYNIGDAVFGLAEPADGPSAAAVESIARDSGVSILYGYPERSGQQIFRFNPANHPHPIRNITRRFFSRLFQVIQKLFGCLPLILKLPFIDLFFQPSHVDLSV